MKPNFALGLTDDGITLWQRDADGWLRVGAVPPDAQDLETQMAGLSKIAAAMAPEGVYTKLVVPRDMLLVTDMPVTARNHEMQAHEIRAQLAGRTPYPVEELDFDWVAEDGTARVIVVARETLVEAEDFARSHGLNPVCNVAAPEDTQFLKEPFFGPTRCARDILGDVSRLERDQTMLRETGLATLPDPELVQEAPKVDAPETEVPAPEAPLPETSQQKDMGAASATDDDRQDQSPPAAPEAAGSEDALPDAEAPEAVAPAPRSSGSSSAEPTPAELRKAALMAKLSPPSATSPTKPAKPSPILPPAATPPSSETPQSAEARAPQDETPPFRSRRASQSATATTDAAPDNRAGSGAKSALGRALSAARNVGLPSKLKTTRDAVNGRAEKAATRAGEPGLAAAAQKSPTGMAKVTIAPRKDPLETLRSHGNTKTASEAERMTVFGARDGGMPDLTTKRRTLLVLGGVGLLLAAIAVWVAYFTFTGRTAQDMADAPLLGDTALAPSEGFLGDNDLDLPSSEEIEAALGVEDAAGQIPLEEPEQAMLPEAQTDEQLQDDAAFIPDISAGRVALLRSPSLIAPQDTVPFESIPDVPLSFAEQSQAPTRAELAAREAQPAELEPDAPESNPVASALPVGEEALEIVVAEGTPPTVPPVRPEGIAPEPEIAPESAEAVVQDPEAAAEDAIAAESAGSDPAAAPPVLAPPDESDLLIAVTEGRPASVPPARPDSVLQEPATAPQPADPSEDAQPEAGLDEDQASLITPPPGGVALSALRPALRPESLIERAAPVEEDEEDMIASASAFAVASSLRPNNRPSQFSTIVQRSMAAAQPVAPSTPQAQPARAAAAPALQIPTSASVAREATQTRAINLRQVNLIGVMGTSSSRRALVRLANGRIVAVRVGEALDGGQVTAIGENELRYSRRGRDVVLRIAS